MALRGKVCNSLYSHVERFQNSFVAQSQSVGTARSLDSLTSQIRE